MTIIIMMIMLTLFLRVILAIMLLVVLAIAFVAVLLFGFSFMMHPGPRARRQRPARSQCPCWPCPLRIDRALVRAALLPDGLLHGRPSRERGETAHCGRSAGASLAMIWAFCEL